jgi:hypothetical protein
MRAEKGSQFSKALSYQRERRQQQSSMKISSLRIMPFPSPAVIASATDSKWYFGPNTFEPLETQAMDGVEQRALAQLRANC